MKWKLLIISTILVFITFYIYLLIPTAQPEISYSVEPDNEANYLISKRIANGEGLYSNFSIVYPPGRFFLQATIFRVLGPTFKLLSLLQIAYGQIIFPILVFLLTIVSLSKLNQDQRDKNPKILIYFLALVSSFVYLSYFRSAQEVHILASLFIISLLISNQATKHWQFIIGVLFSLIFLFRIDAGIILTLAIAVALLTEQSLIKKNAIHTYRFVIVGFLVVWLPTILAIIINGSIKNFLYDTLVLGLTVQPKFMNLPIEDRFRFLFIAGLVFIASSSYALFIKSQRVKKRTHRMGFKILAVFSVLSYVATLGRSDEAHLWYGLVWLPFLFSYALYSFSSLITKRKSKLTISVVTVFVSSILFLFYAFVMVELKSPWGFLASAVIPFVFIRANREKYHSVLIGGTIGALIIFHSINFLKINYQLPEPVAPTMDPYFSAIVANTNELAGGVLSQESKTLLDKIRADIPQSEKYLFIFPQNLFLSEYFGLKSPSRYILLSLERTPKTEREVITDIQRTDTKYVLFFDQPAQFVEGLTKDWILENTQTIYIYEIDGEKIELRKTKQTLSI